MIQVEWGKVLIALSTIIVGIVLILTGDHTAGVAMVMTIVGYTFGNGRLITKGEDPVHMISRKPPPADGGT